MGMSQPPEQSQPPFSARWATGRRLAFVSIILVAIAGVFTARALRQPAAVIAGAPRMRITTQAGERREVRLGDGAVVTLGEKSMVEYVIANARTDVELDGIARFEVAHSSARVFYVVAGNAQITDIGTVFVVRAVETDTAVEVAVMKGRVSVGDRRRQSIPGASLNGQVEIDAGRAASVLRSGTITPVLPIDPRKYSDWMRE